jgi:hypothetical protein
VAGVRCWPYSEARLARTSFSFGEIPRLFKNNFLNFEIAVVTRNKFSRADAQNNEVGGKKRPEAGILALSCNPM